MKVYCVILNYHGKDVLPHAIKSVYASDYSSLEVVVVDNASRDGSLEQAKRLFPRAHFIANKDNIGFASGNNLGIRFALERGADAIFLLNNDAVITRNTLRTLVTASENLDHEAILSPVIYKYQPPRKNPQSIWFCRGSISWIHMQARHATCQLTRNFLPTLWRKNHSLSLVSEEERLQEDIHTLKQKDPYTSQYVTGCAMFIPKEIFRIIGLFDEKFFLYYEDADFCLRAHNQCFPSYVIPKASAFHQEQSEKTNPEKIYWLVLSAILFFRKHATGWKKPWIETHIFLRKMKNAISNIRHTSKITEIVRKAYQDVK